MRFKVITLCLFILSACLITLIQFDSSSAQPTYCTEVVAASADDVDCGFLDEEIITPYDPAEQMFKGIKIDVRDPDEDGKLKLQLGIDTGLIGTRTWNTNQDFEWTFDTTSATKDPSMAFSPYRTTHTGQFVVDTSFASTEENFASDISLEQTELTNANPYGIGSNVHYSGDDSSTTLSSSITFTFYHGTKYVSASNFSAYLEEGKCYRVKPQGEDNWYVVDEIDADEGFT